MLPLSVVAVIAVTPTGFSDLQAAVVLWVTVPDCKKPKVKMLLDSLPLNWSLHAVSCDDQENASSSQGCLLLKGHM